MTATGMVDAWPIFAARAAAGHVADKGEQGAADGTVPAGVAAHGVALTGAFARAIARSRTALERRLAWRWGRSSP